MEKKKILSNFNLFEIIMIAVSFIAYTISAIIINSVLGWVAYLSCITYLFYLVLNAKANFWGFLFCIASYVIYMYIDLKLSYFGEFISGIIAIIINFLTFFLWRKNTMENDKTEIKINSLSRKEIFISLIIGIIFEIVSYFILKTINSSYFLLNSFSITLVSLTYYYEIRRSPLRFLFSLFASIIYFSLWIIAYLQGQSFALPFVVNCILEFICAVYSYINWIKIKTNQTEKNKSKTL